MCRSRYRLLHGCREPRALRDAAEGEPMALRVIEVVLELTELLAPAGLSRHYALRHQPYPPVVQAEEQLLRFVAYLALPDDGGGDAPASSSPPPLPSLRAQMLEEVLRWCEAAFLSCVRSILTDIYLCHACSCHEILSGNAAAGRRARSRPPR
jgi:hypothetical protein